LTTPKEVLRQIRAYPVYLIYIALRVISRMFVGKQRRNKYLSLHPHDLVFFNFVKRTGDNFLFYIRKRGKRGDEIGLSELMHEPEVRKVFQPDKNEVVVDIGAHVGTYSIRLAKRAKLVIAIEPNPSTFQILKHNIKLNELKNVLAINAGIGRENGIMYLEDLDEYGWTKLCRIGEIPVKVRSLDSLREELKIEKVDWIKMDTEGMEIDVLYGAKQTLTKHNPRLIIEIHKDKEEILRFLNGENFFTKEIDINHLFAWKN